MITEKRRVRNNKTATHISEYRSTLLERVCNAFLLSLNAIFQQYLQIDKNRVARVANARQRGELILREDALQTCSSLSLITFLLGTPNLAKKGRIAI